MRTFLASNPGLASRFTKTIEFENYSVNALVTIVEDFRRPHRYTLDHGTHAALAAYFDDILRGGAAYNAVPGARAGRTSCPAGGRVLCGVVTAGSRWGRRGALALGDGQLAVADPYLAVLSEYGAMSEPKLLAVESARRSYAGQHGPVRLHRVRDCRINGNQDDASDV